jgi:hypothetical protein
MGVNFRYNKDVGEITESEIRIAEMVIAVKNR